MKKELSVPKEEEKALTTPGLSEEEMKSMYGDLDKEHITIPRLVVLEQLSPELASDQGKAGDFFVKGLNQNLGKGPLEVVVLMRSHLRLRWKPVGEGGGILCQAMDGKTGVGDPGGDCASCKLKEWQGRIKPQCDLYENFIVVLRKGLAQGEVFPMAISGSRSRLKGLKDFNTILMQSIQLRRPLFSKSYVIKAVEKTNPKIAGNNRYFVFQVSVGNENQQLPAEEQSQAYGLFKSFAGRAFKIEQEAPSSGAEEQPSGTPAY